MVSDQGSPPAMASLTLVSFLMSMPIWSQTSAMWNMYEGVPAQAVTGRSCMSWICLAVLPVPMGRTVAPILSAP